MRRRRAVSYLNGQQIRCVWLQEKDAWFYSAVDFVDALGLSQNPSRYWSDLKYYRKIITDELYDFIVKLKLEGKDGKKYPTDMVSVEILEKICINLSVPEYTKMHKWLTNFRSKKHDPNFGFVVHQKPE